VKKRIKEGRLKKTKQEKLKQAAKEDCHNQQKLMGPFPDSNAN